MLPCQGSAASSGPGGRSNDATTAADMEQEDMTASQMMVVFQELASFLETRGWCRSPDRRDLSSGQVECPDQEVGCHEGPHRP